MVKKRFTPSQLLCMGITFIRYYLEILRNSEFLGTHVYSAAWFVDLEIEQDN